MQFEIKIITTTVGSFIPNRLDSSIDRSNLHVIGLI